MIAKALCNRPAAYSSDAMSYTYTCVADSALIPLFAILYIVAEIGLALRKRATVSVEIKHQESNARRSLPAWIAWLYAILTVAAIAMQVLELARLQVSHSGMGLLIINAVALLVAYIAVFDAYVRNKYHRLDSQCVRLAFWIQLIVWEASKVGTYGKIKKHEDGPTSYKVSDRIVDEAVMLALFVVFAIFEVLAIFRKQRNLPASSDRSEMLVRGSKPI